MKLILYLFLLFAIDQNLFCAQEYGCEIALQDTVVVSWMDNEVFIENDNLLNKPFLPNCDLLPRQTTFDFGIAFAPRDRFSYNAIFNTLTGKNFDYKMKEGVSLGFNVLLKDWLYAFNFRALGINRLDVDDTTGMRINTKEFNFTVGYNASPFNFCRLYFNTSIGYASNAFSVERSSHNKISDKGSNLSDWDLTYQLSSEEGFGGLGMYYYMPLLYSRRGSTINLAIKADYQFYFSNSHWVKDDKDVLVTPKVINNGFAFSFGFSYAWF